MPKLTVRNTFLEFQDDSGDDFLDQDNNWGRALTEPVKVLPHSDERTPNRTLNGLSVGMDAMHPQYIFSGAGPKSDGVRESWKTLASDPDLAEIFDDIRVNGVQALMKYYHDERLMRLISQKGGILNEMRQLHGGGCLEYSPSTKPYESLLPTEPSAGQTANLPEKAMRGPPVPIKPGQARTSKTAGGTAQDRAASTPDVRSVTKAIGKMDETLIENATLQAIRDMTCSVTLADPSQPDCPLIGCSAGFEALTGYSRTEVVGRNCRFLNRGNKLDVGLRRTLQQAVKNGTEFIGILPNTKKNGDVFKNLLHMTTLKVRGRRYIIGVQANVDSIMLDLRNPRHLQELENVATRIFAGNVDAWVQMEEREYSMRLPAPCSDLLKMKSPTQYAAAQHQFVNFNIEQGAVSSERMIHGAPQDDGFSRTGSTEEGETPLHEPWDSRQTTPESAEGLKSAGSKGHPDNCGSECIFYFFRGACRAGIDCHFCHEYHPRKNPKKNRRVMRRILAHQSGEDGMQDGQSQQDGDGIDMVGEHSTDAASFAGAAKEDVSPCEQSTFDAPTPPSVQAAQCRKASKLVTVAYGTGSQFNVEPALVMVAGQYVDIAPLVTLPEDSEMLRGNLVFETDPALPAGLALEPATGRIVGTPVAAQEAAGFTITVSTCAAVGPQGIPLGRVPLNSCSLTISIVDIQNIALAWGQKQDNRLVMEYIERR